MQPNDVPGTHITTQPTVPSLPAEAMRAVLIGKYLTVNRPAIHPAAIPISRVRAVGTGYVNMAFPPSSKAEAEVICEGCVFGWEN